MSRERRVALVESLNLYEEALDCCKNCYYEPKVYVSMIVPKDFSSKEIGFIISEIFQPSKSDLISMFEKHVEMLKLELKELI